MSPNPGKLGVIEWLVKGHESYIDRKTSIRILNVADTAPGYVFASARRSYLDAVLDKKSKLARLKWIDHVIQLISGTLAFAAIQLAFERLRQNFLNKKTPLAYAMGFIAIVGGLSARFGLFCTQILASAIRLPVALLSGTVGVIAGLFSSFSGKPFLETLSRYVWPFAPAVGGLMALVSQLDNIRDQTKRDSNKRMVYQTLFMHALFIAIATTLVVLLAASTGGIGLAALPVLSAIAGTIGTVVAPMVAAFGFTTAGTGALAGFTLLNGFVVHGLGLGALAKTIVLGTMLVGAMSSFFSQIAYSVRVDWRARAEIRGVVSDLFSRNVPEADAEYNYGKYDSKQYEEPTYFQHSEHSQKAKSPPPSSLTCGTGAGAMFSRGYAWLTGSSKPPTTRKLADTPKSVGTKN